MPEAQFILGDITSIELPRFDYVICLNNTLGYILDRDAAIENMRRAGSMVIISVYGERFTDDLGMKYFRHLGLHPTVKNDTFVMREDVPNVKRHTREEVERWGDVVETPLGYISTQRAPRPKARPRVSRQRTT